MKVTRAELARRKRIALYKKVIIYGFLTMTILPIFTSVFCLYKISHLEKDLDYMMSEQGGDYVAYRQSKDELKDNPLAKSGAFSTEAQGVLSGEKVNTNSTKNTEEEQAQETSTEALQEVASKRVYLTFDDGPSIYTGQILDILNANGVKATFFVVGKDEEYNQYYKRIVDEGHTIGMHSYSHVYQDFYQSKESFAKELKDLGALIYNVTGKQCTVFRFPGGSSNTVASLPIQEYISYLNEEGITYYDWNALSGDAVSNGLSPEQLVDNIMNDVEKNEDSIVLMHDLQTTHATVESLQLLIDTLKSEGYEILPIDENTPKIQHVPAESVEE